MQFFHINASLAKERRYTLRKSSLQGILDGYRDRQSRPDLKLVYKICLYCCFSSWLLSGGRRGFGARPERFTADHLQAFDDSGLGVPEAGDAVSRRLPRRGLFRAKHPGGQPLEGYIMCYIIIIFITLITIGIATMILVITIIGCVHM